MGPLKDGPSADGELLGTIPAPVIAKAFASTSRDAPITTAMGADNISVPSPLFQVNPGRLLTGETFEKLKGANG